MSLIKKRVEVLLPSNNVVRGIFVGVKSIKTGFNAVGVLHLETDDGKTVYVPINNIMWIKEL